MYIFESFKVSKHFKALNSLLNAKIMKIYFCDINEKVIGHFVKKNYFSFKISSETDMENNNKSIIS